MSIIIINHQVKDFSSWRPFFEAHESVRTQAGLRFLHMGTRQGNPNDVFLLFEADDLGKVRQFVSSNEFKQLTQKAGVVSEPIVTVLDQR